MGQDNTIANPVFTLFIQSNWLPLKKEPTKKSLSRGIFCDSSTFTMRK